jgi:hypothetical protein
VWADTVTFRVGDRLVGVRPDTDRTAALLRTTFADWLTADAVAEAGDSIPPAFSLRLDRPAESRGPTAVPQLRIGGTLLARSRDAAHVVAALDAVLGGVLARQDDELVWLGLRPFVWGNRLVLVDAAPPALSAHPRLRRHAIAELPAWSVAVDDTTVTIPPPLTATRAEPAWVRYELAGLVALDRCNGPGDDPAHADHHHPTTPAALLARFATRHPSSHWFHTVDRLVQEGRVHGATERNAAVDAVIRLLDDET